MTQEKLSLTSVWRHGYLADNQRALLGRGHGWLTLHIVMDNHGSHGFCFPIAQIQRRPTEKHPEVKDHELPSVEDILSTLITFSRSLEDQATHRPFP